VQAQIERLRGSAQDIVRHEYLNALEKHTKRDTILYASAQYSASPISRGGGAPQWVFGVNDQDIHGFMAALKGLKRRQLDLILHSPGGSAEAAEQIVNYLRGKYDHIRAIVPQNAMSAATMMACACDEIVMGRQSAIGPIDPQVVVSTKNGQRSVAAEELLREFRSALAETKADPRCVPLWVAKVQQLPPGIHSTCETLISMAKEKVKTWLHQYMFANDPDGATKAKSIADWLGTMEFHKTHGHPIDINLAKRQGLKVSQLESDPTLQDLVLSVLHALDVTFMTTTCGKIVENHEGKGWCLVVQPNGKPPIP